MSDLVARRHRGELRPGEIRAAAARAGVGERTLWRWIAAGRPLERGRPSPRRLVLTPELRDAYLRRGGNVSAVWREARERGFEPPPLRTLQAAFARELSPAERASARRGEAGRREHGLYLRYEAPHRNAVWQGDHKQLPALVVPPGRRRGRRPWVTLFLDDFSRVSWAGRSRCSPVPPKCWSRCAPRSSWTQTATPSAGSRAGCGGITGWSSPPGRSSRGALALGIDVDPARPYAPHEKGKIERLHRTITNGFVAGLPTWTGGPRDHRGQLDTPGAPLALTELVARFTPGCAPTTPSGRTAASAARRPCSAGRRTRRRCDWWRPRTRGGC
ncbi:MAG: hypothetical protein Q8K79_01990 [Solirubrobacteraceae bacterium]|nr:hypothetical protein [Solirubrobacteraceae bacterium]